ncbi:MAG: LuxR C-terminal-related transcriptional regulator [Armatimonadetes bacterium]|nr:LuxR C-terminal-related transcriptional regulator [Armatimonadota bacterium]MCX7968556.1 LuxR C-terminal-related transcriptional regulator [Armatimonadota bacterium]MDW8141897.1 LuxR C-terminal-related transcriptional regulator [Armatimonadota bacterium]
MPRSRMIDAFCNDCLIRLAFEGLSTAIALTDEKSRLIFVNRAAGEIFGILESDIGRPIQKAIQDLSLLALWSEACQREEPVMSVIKVSVPSERLLRVTVGICRTEKGNIIGRALLACDVTEDRRVVLEVSEELAKALLSHRFTYNGQSPNLSELTPMEWRILRLLGKGLGNAEIASNLMISLNTLRTHLKSIYRKLNLPNRNAAVAFAAQLQQRLPDLSLTLLG